jgi:4-amino-4-deoxy-L-arabinose transferase-like glycosyltransferase
MIKNVIRKLAKIGNNLCFQYGLLLVIILLAFALRFYKLGEWSFWIDEIRTVNRATVHYSTFESLIHNIPPATNWIPLSTILTASAINFLGLSEWSARFIPALIGIISVPVLFFPIKRLLGPMTALITALLLAVSPWHIEWSQNARYLTSLLLFYTLALFAIYFGLERDRFWYFLLFIVLLYLATSERLYTLFIVPVLFSYLFLLKVLQFEKPPGFRARNLLILISPGVIFIAIEIYSIVASGTSRFFADFGGFLGSSIETPVAQTFFIFSEIGIPLVAFSFFTGIYLVLKKNRAGLFLWLAAVIPVVLLILITPFTFTEERYIFITLSSWLILGAIGVREIFTQTTGYAKLLAVGVLVLLLADTVGDNFMYYRENNGNRRDWRGAFALVKEKSSEGDIVVSTWPELGNYYLQQEIISWQNTNRDDVVARNNRVWFVIIPDMAWFWGSQNFYRWVKNNAELIDVKYLRRQDDANLYIYLYEPAPMMDE